MLDAELGKEVRKMPVVEFEIPKHIICQHEAGEDSLLVKLWDFEWQ
jgi:U3 small nucleolar RNA-associated protein 19